MIEIQYNPDGKETAILIFQVKDMKKFIEHWNSAIKRAEGKAENIDDFWISGSFRCQTRRMIDVA